MNTEGGGVRIEIAEAKAKLESGEAVALDLVQPQAWDQIDGAVTGAVRIPPQEIEQRFEELPRDLDIVAYCT
jgi:rhodanese-related sulfurtransferase